VVGIDNLNDYYDIQLKKDRLRELGIIEFESTWTSSSDKLCFIKMDLQEKESLLSLFSVNRFDYVIHLAAQAGVRYSLTEPQKYVDSNITGFLNILECCREYPVKHLLFASSSSVYGMKTTAPFTETDNTDSPISLYAATKKANELMAFTYAHLYKIPITAMRFFTVYGPWGRPDMAYFLFAKNISEEIPIQLFGEGLLKRDFTFVDDVVESIFRLMPLIPDASEILRKLNIGNSCPIEVNNFVRTIEKIIGKKAIVEHREMQPGDVNLTYSDSREIEKLIKYSPVINIEYGLKIFFTWYSEYYHLDNFGKSKKNR
jgi:UDP-glucuronate 4-epimerase